MCRSLGPTGRSGRQVTFGRHRIGKYRKEPASDQFEAAAEYPPGCSNAVPSDPPGVRKPVRQAMVTKPWSAL
jgi:hypothetical protein